MSTLISFTDRRRRPVRVVLLSVQVLAGAAVALAGFGPLLWLAKGSVSSTQDLLTHPAALWPAQLRLDNIGAAWDQLAIGHYLVNSVILAAGCWAAQLFVAVTCGFGLSVLKPRWGGALSAAILATLFVPGTVTMIALYATILHLPLTGTSLSNTWWAVWLPAAANAVNVLLIKRFFDGIPAELIEAAQVDGAGPVTILRRIVLPMARPVLAVVSLLAVVASWKDFLWPLIALPDPEKQPLSVALPRLAQGADQSLLIAGLFIATVPPVLLFAVFHKQIVRGVGGFTGVKG